MREDDRRGECGERIAVVLPDLEVEAGAPQQVANVGFGADSGETPRSRVAWGPERRPSQVDVAHHEMPAGPQDTAELAQRGRTVRDQ